MRQNSWKREKSSAPFFARKPKIALEAVRLKKNMEVSLETLGKVVLALIDRI